MNRMIARLLPLGALAALACMTTPAADPASPIGCWYFARDAAAAAFNLPWGIRLDSAELTGWPTLDARGGGRAAVTLKAEGPADHPFGYWRELDGDSIEVGYPAGGGIALRLARGELEMSGSARDLGDVNPSAARPAVRLTRAQCPSY